MAYSLKITYCADNTTYCLPDGDAKWVAAVRGSLVVLLACLNNCDGCVPLPPPPPYGTAPTPPRSGQRSRFGLAGLPLVALFCCLLASVQHRTASGPRHQQYCSH